VTAGRRLATWLYAVAAGAYFLDRVTKAIAVRTLQDRPPARIIPGILHLNFTTNSGGAFGLFGGQPWLFFAASVVVGLLIVVASTRLSSPRSAVALGLILGGALGNLTDRILRGPGVSGRVIDFIDLQVWPVFNLADSAIVIGAIVMVLSGLRTEQTAGATNEGGEGDGPTGSAPG
jgi:signal peptidase II